MVEASGSELMTPEIVLSMMTEFVIMPQEVMAHAYVSIANGHKRHNMAKVYAGYYDYDDATIERLKRECVPIFSSQNVATRSKLMIPNREIEANGTPKSSFWHSYGKLCSKNG
jgi:Chitin synthase